MCKIFYLDKIFKNEVHTVDITNSYRGISVVMDRGHRLGNSLEETIHRNQFKR